MTKEPSEEKKKKSHVTDKSYYMDGYLKQNLNFLRDRIHKRWDNLIVIDGEEGAGKSTFGKQIAYYLAYELKRDFTADHIFFDIEKMSHYASENREKVIVWDESALGGMAQDWQDKTQKKLIKLLITCRKYNHIFIFIIPLFTKLNEYLATSRSIALLRVYSPNRLDRGRFICYSKNKKKKLYEMEKLKYRGRVIPSFYGTFLDTEGLLIDEEKYEKNKDMAIESIFNEEKKPSKKDEANKRKLLLLMDYMIENHGLKNYQFQDILGLPSSSISGLRRDIESMKKGIQSFS